MIKDASNPDATNLYGSIDIFTIPSSGSVTTFTTSGTWFYKWIAIG